MFDSFEFEAAHIFDHCVIAETIFLTASILTTHKTPVHCPSKSFFVTSLADTWSNRSLPFIFFNTKSHTHTAYTIHIYIEWSSKRPTRRRTDSGVFGLVVLTLTGLAGFRGQNNKHKAVARCWLFVWAPQTHSCSHPWFSSVTFNLSCQMRLSDRSVLSKAAFDSEFWYYPH